MIIGYNFEEINAKREKEAGGKIDINSTVKITSVEEKEIDIGGKRKVAEIGFEFTIEYKPNIGYVKMKGSVLYVDGKDLLKNWEKEKKLPESIDIEVKNFLFKKCLTIGIAIAEELRLPSPLPFPAIVPKREEKSYIG